MKIEEAKKTIQELLNSNESICEYMLKHQEIEAMQKLLNELDKNDAEITQLKKREWLIKYKLERDVEIYSQDGCCRKQVRKGIVREAKEILELLGDDVNEH